MTYSVVEAPVAGGLLRGGRWRPEGGDAPPVLLVHGVTAHHGSWFAVADAAPLLVAGDENKFMTRIALMTKPPLEKKAAEKKDKKAASTESE